ncbi:sulfurtransferase [Caldalkalibacillus salinus]|uniref:sulfurtransferase n=1 Tax=Caldalkalibacillus salinus TaxID=2803787 RepID=UPI0019209769|nr:sulfurtransferase [Caldalkalibacillus salinus]
MRKPTYTLLTLFVAMALIVSACADSETSNEAATERDYANPELLVSPDWLDAHQDDENLRIVDMREEGYDTDHIPNAVHLGSWRELVDADHEVEGYLVGPQDFEQIMSQLGIDGDTTVVIYDEGNSLSATRLFYALEYYGHEDVKILNGGYSAWLVEEKEVTSDVPEIEDTTFAVELNEDLVCDLGQVQDKLNEDRDSVVFLDTRSEEEHTGENVRAERGGHIPGSVNIEWNQSLQDDGVPYFREAAELYELYESNGITADKQIVSYCQTNVRGAHTYFTLRLLGFEDLVNYEGSWAEYGNSESTDIE